MRATIHRIFAMFFLIICVGLSFNVVSAIPITDADWISAGQAKGFDRDVFSLAVDRQGTLFASGGFSLAGGAVAQFGIAQWDGSLWKSPWSGFTPENGENTLDREGRSSLVVGENGVIYFVNGGVYALAGAKLNNLFKNIDGAATCAAWYNGVLYVAGNFWDSLGQTLPTVMKWKDSAWTPVGGGIRIEASGECINALAIDSSGNLYAGGNFNSAGEISLHNIAKWNGSTWSALGNGISFTVHAMTVGLSSTLYAGGYDEGPESDGYRRYKSVSKWNGTSWKSIESSTTGTINALVCDKNGTLFAGGTFESMGNEPARNAAKWNGTAWERLGSGIDGDIAALALGNHGELYAAGWIGSVSGYLAGHIAQWNGTVWLPLGSGRGLNGNVDLLTMDTYGRVFAGWHEDESLRGPNVVCMDENGWMPLGRGVGSDGINALLADNKGGAYVGGPVAPYGKPILGLAHWDGSQWIDMGLGVGRIKAMASDNAGDIYAGGDFTGGIRDTAWGNVAWWNGSGWRHLDKGFNGMVSVLSVNENGCLYAGGGFDSAGIQPTLHIAQWNGVTWVPLGSGLGRKNSFSIIRSIVFNSQGNLFAAGDFDSAGGRSAARVAQWDGENWSPLRKGMRCTVNPSGNGSEATVYSLVFDKDGYLFAGGSFDSAGSAMAHNIARWDGIDWAPLGSGCNKAVRSMVLDKYGILHVGGIFDSVGGVFSPYYAMCKVFAPYVKSTRVGAMATAMKVENGRLRIRLAAACEVSTRLMTLSGREAYHSRMIMPAGDHVVGLKAPGLGRGVYIAYVHYGTESKMWRMIVER